MSLISRWPTTPWARLVFLLFVSLHLITIERVPTTVLILGFTYVLALLSGPVFVAQAGARKANFAVSVLGNRVIVAFAALDCCAPEVHALTAGQYDSCVRNH